MASKGQQLSMSLGFTVGFTLLSFLAVSCQYRAEKAASLSLARVGSDVTIDVSPDDVEQVRLVAEDRGGFSVMWTTRTDGFGTALHVQDYQGDGTSSSQPRTAALLGRGVGLALDACRLGDGALLVVLDEWIPYAPAADDLSTCSGTLCAKIAEEQKDRGPRTITDQTNVRTLVIREIAETNSASRLLNSYTPGWQAVPVVACRGDGGVALWNSSCGVTRRDGHTEWTTSAPDCDRDHPDGVYARRINGTAAGDGEEFRLGTWARDSRSNVSVSMTPDGGVVATGPIAVRNGDDYDWRVGIVQLDSADRVVVQKELATPSQRAPVVSCWANDVCTLAWPIDGGVATTDLRGGIFSDVISVPARKPEDAAEGWDLNVTSFRMACSERGLCIFVWSTTESTLHDGDMFMSRSLGLSAQLYDAEKREFGAEIRVAPADTLDDLDTPAIASLTQDRFAVAWPGSSKDNRVHVAVYGQR